MKIQAAVAYEKDQPLIIEDLTLAEPTANEILVKIVASGLCHTDEVALQQLIPVPLPAVLGHEGSGIVEKVGNNVTEFKAGDHVGLSFGFCGKCENCLSAKPFACVDFNTINFGGTLADGNRPLSRNDQKVASFFGQSSFATHAIVHQNSMTKVEDNNIDLTLVGPLGCGIQTGAGAVFNRLKPEFASTIAIFGAGTVGLSAIMAAKIAGCKSIIAIDLQKKNLAMAEELGATHTFNPKTDGEVVPVIKDITKGGSHYAIDTTGNSESVKNALASLRFSGKLTILGVTGELTINVQKELMSEGKTMAGCVEGDSNPKIFIPQLLEYYKKGLFPFDKFITSYEFVDINQAFEDAHKGKTIKAVLKMPT